MKFVFEYRTSDNVHHDGVVVASNREAAFAILKVRGIRPFKLAEAPGVLNKLFGKGKRWIAIGVLALLASCFALLAMHFHQTSNAALEVFDALERRQVVGDAAVIAKGIKTGWSDAFTLEGERFLASFAIPGVPATVRNTTEDQILRALAHDCRDSHPRDSECIEFRQIRAMVEGMKQELRDFLADGGTIHEYGQELVKRQEQETSYYSRAKTEIEVAEQKLSTAELMKLWEKRNASLRKMGIRLLPLE